MDGLLEYESGIRLAPYIREQSGGRALAMYHILLNRARNNEATGEAYAWLSSDELSLCLGFDLDRNRGAAKQCITRYRNDLKAAGAIELEKPPYPGHASVYRVYMTPFGKEDFAVWQAYKSRDRLPYDKQF